MFDFIVLLYDAYMGLLRKGVHPQYLLDAIRLSDLLEEAAYDPPMPVDT